MSDIRDPDRDQVLPTPNDNPSCHDLVISDLDMLFSQGRVGDGAKEVAADIDGRKEHGLKKYGSLLQIGNGRSMALDAYEEALDLLAYLRGMLDELRTQDVFDSNIYAGYTTTMYLAVRLKKIIQEESRANQQEA